MGEKDVRRHPGGRQNQHAGGVCLPPRQVAEGQARRHRQAEAEEQHPEVGNIRDEEALRHGLERLALISIPLVWRLNALGSQEAVANLGDGGDSYNTNFAGEFRRQGGSSSRSFMDTLGMAACSTE